MAIVVEVNRAAGIAIFKLSAPLSAESFCSALNELLAHPDFVPGMNMLAVFDPGCVADLSFGEICSISEYEASKVEQLGSDYKLALVVSTPVDFGMSRMYETWSERYPREFRIFHSLAEARAWVCAETPATGVRACRPLPGQPTGTGER